MNTVGKGAYVCSSFHAIPFHLITILTQYEILKDKKHIYL